MTSPPEKQVVFVLSVPRSGSTLLGHFLSAHDQIFHVGEIPGTLAKKRCVRCLYCGYDECPVWGTVIRRSLVESCYEAQQSDCPEKFSLSRLIGRCCKRGHCESAAPGDIFDAIFTAFSSLDVIIDSSKSIPWARWNSRNPEFRSRFILLTRDLRGVTNSIRRNRPGKVTTIARSLRRQVKRFQRFTYQQPPADVLHVTYENLASAPMETGLRVCEFLGVPFEDRMLEYFRFPDHIMGGNGGTTLQTQAFNGKSSDYLISLMGDQRGRIERYVQAAPGLNPDERWKRELDRHSLTQIDRVAGRLNRRLGYE